jgi:hypothetical protein
MLESTIFSPEHGRSRLVAYVEADPDPPMKEFHSKVRPVIK